MPKKIFMNIIDIIFADQESSCPTFLHNNQLSFLGTGCSELDIFWVERSANTSMQEFFSLSVNNLLFWSFKQKFLGFFKSFITLTQS